jgi:hypothetical protein
MPNQFSFLSYFCSSHTDMIMCNKSYLYSIITALLTMYCEYIGIKLLINWIYKLDFKGSSIQFLLRKTNIIHCIIQNKSINVTDCVPLKYLFSTIYPRKGQFILHLQIKFNFCIVFFTGEWFCLVYLTN